ncbi:MAG: hemerythrin family protein [Alphaproteobacteria bacterium]|nr:hemerythrin family protein [Alphaproteobacteria bacterium]MDE2110961.1 hemerythrin family protein [Alphaproteobacteria bacterium]MDE2493646.1 hemerythrin family protein [Alphaproteobacteria bacterium]
MASYMTWTDAFSIGVVQFDEEHKQLIELVNELHDSICAGTTGETLKRIYDALVAHTVAHFDHEEEYFDAMHYPRAGQHKAMHEHLKRALIAFHEKIGRKDSARVAEEMLRFLGDSLGHHIHGEDKKYGAFLNQHGIA